MRVFLGNVEVTGTAPEEGPVDLRISGRVALDVLRPALSESAEILDALHQENTLSFKIEREHDDAETAEGFVFGHIRQLAGVVDTLKVLGAWGTATFEKGALADWEIETEGATSRISYKFATGAQKAAA